MRIKTWKFFWLWSVFAFSPAFAEIVETAHFAEIERYASPDVLLLLDIDDTLFVPAQMLGSDVWFQHEVKKESLEKALALWEAIRHFTEVCIVEPGAEKIVQKLQARNVPIMALTTQGFALNSVTVRQLNALHFDLSKTAPCKQECYFLNGQGVLYRDGILFTSGTDKGKTLLKFLDFSKISPKKIIFINDKKTHLENVESALKERNIPFVGLRYSFSDQRISQFRPEIAEIQLQHSSLGHILSDAEAEAFAISKADRSLNYTERDSKIGNLTKKCPRFELKRGRRRNSPT